MADENAKSTEVEKKYFKFLFILLTAIFIKTTWINNKLHFPY